MTQRHQNCHCPQCLRQQRYSYACPSGSSPSCHNDPYLYKHIGSPHHHLCTHHDQISRHCLNAPHLSHDNHYPIKLPHPRETYRQQHDDRAQYEEDQCPVPCPFYHDQHYQAQHENNANASPISPPAAVSPVRVVAAGRDGGVLSPQHPSRTRFPHHLKRDDQRPSKPASPGALSQNQNQNQTAHRETEREAPAWRPRPSKMGWFVHGFIFPLRPSRRRGQQRAGDEGSEFHGHEQREYGREYGYGSRGRRRNTRVVREQRDGGGRREGVWWRVWGL